MPISHLRRDAIGEEAERRLGELLKKVDIDPSSLVGLHILKIANLLALKKSGTVHQKLQELWIFASGQPESFHAGLSFDAHSTMFRLSKFLRLTVLG